MVPSFLVWKGPEKDGGSPGSAEMSFLVQQQEGTVCVMGKGGEREALFRLATS